MWLELILLEQSGLYVSPLWYHVSKLNIAERPKAGGKNLGQTKKSISHLLSLYVSCYRLTYTRSKEYHTNVNADDISSILPRVDKAIKTRAQVTARLVYTFLGTVPILSVTFINIITRHAIVTQIEARRTWAAEWSSGVFACVLAISLSIVIGALIDVRTIAWSAKKNALSVLA